MITVCRVNVANKVRLFGQIISTLFVLHAALEAHAGQVSVSDGGTASYSMPIAVPPGIAGMAPNIGLLYSGSAVNGPVGYGWTIQGISMITRCAANKLIDGAARGVDYTANDKLCLDGQRLIQTDANGVVVNASISNPSLVNPFQQNDSLGGSGLVREYRTEKDMYARIRAYGAAGGNAANGPAYFKVWTKSGQIYEYGVNSNATANAQIGPTGKAVVAWPVSRISDTLGNYIDFQYEQRDLYWGSVPSGGNATGHEWNLLEIRYTGNASQAPTNKVVFTYGDRADNPGGLQDRAETYHQGNKNVSIRLLNSVRTYVNWPSAQLSQPSNAVKVKTVKLLYSNGSITNRSRLSSIQECVGASEASCLPATKFNYSDGGSNNYTPSAQFKNGSLPTLLMQNLTGSYGTMTGNFFGSGRSDIIRWSDNPAENQLYQNTGDGNFNIAAGFNIKDQNIFKSDGCYTSIAADFNGDGLTDILRIMRYSSPSTNALCGNVQNVLYLNSGNGSFTATTIPGIDFTQVPHLTVRGSGGTAITQGANFYLLDVNNDGLLDIVTTIYPGTPAGKTPIPTETACASQICTHVYAGQANGSFLEIPTSLAHHSVYGAPPINLIYSYINRSNWNPSYTGDANGDGLTDLFVDNGVWFSLGNGDFALNLNVTNNGGCPFPLDVNGDGRSDCLYPALNSSLSLSDGTPILKPVSNFNLYGTGFELLGNVNGPGTSQNIGIQIADMNGDGRSDILRWKDDPSQNAVFLSNGDGTFRQDSSFNLNTTADQLQKSDGSASFILGDFTGHGNTEILRLIANPVAGSFATTNVLYVKSDPTPPDQLTSIVSGTGLISTLTWVPLTNSVSGNLGARFVSDLGTVNASSYPLVDLTTPTYVVATLSVDTGIQIPNIIGVHSPNGQSDLGTYILKTEYSYAGLKVALDGRGWLGFREIRRQNIAPDGNSPLTVMTQYLMQDPYIGMASSTETWLASLNAVSPQILSTTSYVYCDTTSATNGTAATYLSPCVSSAKVKRPYLYQSVEQGKDIDGTLLPQVTTTNTFNNSGDPTQIVSTTQGSAFGMAQQFTKSTVNQYSADNTAGDNWILGRLQGSTVLNTVPNSLGGISTSTNGTPYQTPPPVTPSVPVDPATLKWLVPVLTILELN